MNHPPVSLVGFEKISQLVWRQKTLPRKQKVGDLVHREDTEQVGKNIEIFLCSPCPLHALCGQKLLLYLPIQLKCAVSAGLVNMQFGQATL